MTHNGSKRTGLDPVEFGVKLQNIGVGEILIEILWILTELCKVMIWI